MAEKEYDADLADLEFEDLFLEDLSVDEEGEGEGEDCKVKCLPASQAGGGVEKSKRVTTPYLTKYERARVLGEYCFSQLTLFQCSFFVNCLFNISFNKLNIIIW